MINRDDQIVGDLPEKTIQRNIDGLFGAESRLKRIVIYISCRRGDLESQYPEIKKELEAYISKLPELYHDENPSTFLPKICKWFMLFGVLHRPLPPEKFRPLMTAARQEIQNKIAAFLAKVEPVSKGVKSGRIPDVINLLNKYSGWYFRGYLIGIESSGNHIYSQRFSYYRLAQSMLEFKFFLHCERDSLSEIWDKIEVPLQETLAHINPEADDPNYDAILEFIHLCAEGISDASIYNNKFILEKLNPWIIKIIEISEILGKKINSQDMSNELKEQILLYGLIDYIDFFISITCEQIYEFELFRKYFSQLNKKFQIQEIRTFLSKLLFQISLQKKGSWLGNELFKDNLAYAIGDKFILRPNGRRLLYDLMNASKRIAEKDDVHIDSYHRRCLVKYGKDNII